MIYLYWEGERRHWFYELCLKTIRNHNPTVIVLNEENAFDIVGPLPAELRGIYITHKVDWIRKAVIRATGGMWLDMDFICLKDLSALAGLSGDFDYVGFKEWGGTWMDNFFVGKAGSKILDAAAEFALTQIRGSGKDIAWLATNAYAIDYAMARHPWCKWMQIPTHLVSPHSVMEPHWFAAEIDGDEMRSYDAFGFMTSFHQLQDWLSSRTEHEFLAGKTRLARLVRMALE